MTPPPPEVVVNSVSRGEVPIQLSYSGRTAGSREVEVRARVSGILLERLYEEGKRVREGEVLFRIDPEPFRAAAAQARAELAVAVAQRDEARRNRDRLVPLFEKSAVSRRERDAAVSAFEIGEANVAAAQARLRTAQLELGYTEVRAPISGLASREERSEGSLVTAGEDSSLLTRIVQTDPLYVDFSIAESEAALLRERAHQQPAADRSPRARQRRRARDARHGHLHRQRRRHHFGNRTRARRPAEPGCGTPAGPVRQRASVGRVADGGGVACPGAP